MKICTINSGLMLSSARCTQQLWGDCFTPQRRHSDYEMTGLAKEFGWNYLCGIGAKLFQNLWNFLYAVELTKGMPATSCK